MGMQCMGAILWALAQIYMGTKGGKPGGEVFMQLLWLDVEQFSVIVGSSCR